MVVVDNVSEQLFAGKVFVITGGTRGLGADLTKALLQRGATVIALFKSDVSRADELKEWAHKHALSLEVKQLDVSNREACLVLAQDIHSRYGIVHGLVNNAAVMVRSTIHNITPDEISYSLDNNVVGIIHITQALWSLLTAQQGGAIINVSSAASRTGKPSELMYATTKGAVDALTRALAREAGPHQMSVNAIAPHAMGGGMGQDSMNADPSMLARIPFNRVGRVNEFTNLVLFLLSGASPYLTGQVIHLNGGRSMMG